MSLALACPPGTSSQTSSAAAALPDDGLWWWETSCPCGGRDHPRHEVDDLALDLMDRGMTEVGLLLIRDAKGYRFIDAGGNR